MVNDQYDFEDRLINRNNGQIVITYDGDGNRVSKSVRTATNTITTHYLVDDQNPTGYAQVLEEWVSTNNQPASLDHVYTHGHIIIAQTRFENGAPVVSFYGQDGHGNVRYLTDLGGNVTDTYDYDAFGILIAQTGSTPNHYLYCGEQFDSDLGLYYNRARYLNSDSGRFWTMDPFIGILSSPKTLHRYSYAFASPITLIDSSGLITIAEVLESLGIDSQLQKTVGLLVRRAAKNAAEGLVCKELKRQVVSGIYIILLDGNLYVGQSKDIARRIKEWEREGARFVGALSVSTGMGPERAKKFIREIIEQVAVDKIGGNGSEHNNPINESNLQKRMDKWDPVQMVVNKAFKLIPICKAVKDE